MKLRVKLRHWPISFMVQAVAVISHYLIEVTWDQPPFIANLVPAYLATIFAQVFMILGNKFNLIGINPWTTGVWIMHCQ